MMAGVERWGLMSATSVDKCAWTVVCTRDAFSRKETGPETTAVVRVVMFATWKYDNEDYVLVVGNEVIADVQRRENHSCTDVSISMSFQLRV